MNKWQMIACLALWVTTVVQGLTIRDLQKRIENEQKWSEYWRESWLRERNRQCFTCKDYSNRKSSNDQQGLACDDDGTLSKAQSYLQKWGE